VTTAVQSSTRLFYCSWSALLIAMLPWLSLLSCSAHKQLARAVAEAKASSILTTGSVQLGHVGSYLRSRHGYLVAIRHANAVKRPRAYLRMLQHTYLVIRGLEGLEGEGAGQALLAPSNRGYLPLQKSSMAAVAVMRHPAVCSRSELPHMRLPAVLQD